MNKKMAGIASGPVVKLAGAPIQASPEPVQPNPALVTWVCFPSKPIRSRFTRDYQQGGRSQLRWLYVLSAS
jgi:hypothetical protein